MTRTRKTLVYSLVLFLVGIHMVCAIKRKEWWPLSHYPMYAKRVTVPLGFYELKGLPADGAEREIPIPTEVIEGPRYLRVRFGLVKTLGRVKAGHVEPAVLEGALRDTAELYNYHRSAGNSDIEELGGMRLYRQVWVRAEKSHGHGPDDANPVKSGWRLQSRDLIAEGMRKTLP